MSFPGQGSGKREQGFEDINKVSIYERQHTVFNKALSMASIMSKFVIVAWF